MAEGPPTPPRSAGGADAGEQLVERWLAHRGTPLPSAPTPPVGPDAREAGRSVLAAFREQAQQTEQAGQAGQAGQTVRDAETAAPAPTAPPSRPSRPDAFRAPRRRPPTEQPHLLVPDPDDPEAHDESDRHHRGDRADGAAGHEEGPEVGPSTDVDFPVRAGARRALTALLAAGVVATVLLALPAAPTWEPLDLAPAGGAAALTLVLWAVRAASPPTRLTLRRGQLGVQRGGERLVVDLASPYTPLEVRGEPGRPGWRVRLFRADGTPLDLTSGVVDPQLFMAHLRRYRTL